MTDLVGSVSTAISLAKRLKGISENIRAAEFKNLLADLTLELANLKLRLADVLNENARLRSEVSDLRNVDGEPCPKCGKRGWQLESSKPDPTFEVLGGLRRRFKCSLCGFTEERLDTPE